MEPRETSGPAWLRMEIDDDSLPGFALTNSNDARRTFEYDKLCKSLLSLPSTRTNEKLTQVVTGSSPNFGAIEAFAAVVVEGADPLPDTLRGMLQSHYLLASAVRGLVQMFAMTAVMPPDHNPDTHVETTQRLLGDLKSFVCTTFFGTDPTLAMPVVAFLLYAWVIPLAERNQAFPIYSSCIYLLRMCAALSSETPVLPVPTHLFGWSSRQFAIKARVAAFSLFGPMPNGPNLEDVELYASALQPSLRELSESQSSFPMVLAKSVKTRTGFRLDRRFHAFLASLPKAPLPYPPFETRSANSADDSNLEFDITGKRAVQKVCAGKPQEIPLSMLPACAARSLWYKTPKSQGGGWEHGDGVWSNDDRYHMAMFMQDAGEFPIEEMDRFFADRLRLEGSAVDVSRRTRHALHHVQSHRGKIEAKRQRGDPPYITPTCRTMAKTESMSDRRTFRCPFALDDDDETGLRLTLRWQGHSEAAVKQILSARDRESPQHACLAAYERTSGRSRHRPFAYPHHYTYFAALNEDQQ